MIPPSKWTAKDLAFLVTLLVHMAAIVWWGSKITTSVDNLASITKDLQTGYTDLRVRMAVQEALAGQEASRQRER